MFTNMKAARCFVGSLLGLLTATAVAQVTPTFVTEFEYAGGTVISPSRPLEEQLRNVGGRVVIPEFPIPGGGTIDLELTRFHVTTPATKFVVGRKGQPDQVLDFDHQSIVHLRGKVAGVDTSHVVLTVSPWGSAGRIEMTPSGPIYGIASRMDAQTPLPDGRLVVFPGKSGFSPTSSMPAWCGTDTSGWKPIAPPQGAPDGGLRIKGLQQLQLAVETDYEYYSRYNDLNAAGAYVVQLFAQVSDIYIRDVNCHVQLTFVRLWDDPNDLFNEPDPLGPFRNYWNANMGHVTRDTALFLSGRRNLPWGGVAYLPGLCNNNSYSVCGYTTGFFADPTIPHVFNHDIMVTAHEIGHNCNTPHTHDLGLDECDDGTSQPQRGTIMSYCGQTFTGGNANQDLRFDTVTAGIMYDYTHSVSCLADDCNGNGVADATDITNGTSLDLNGNGIPDECEDCNNNQRLDDEDIRLGFSLDLNGNGIPDECEPDCNNNGVPDDMDFLPRIGNIVFHDNFETDTGWTLTNLGATSGDWERGVPVNDPQWEYDPASDYDGSGQCMLTENAPGNTDVDNGATRITSPRIDMSVGGLSVSYAYYLNLTRSGQEDRILVEGNSADGAGAWAQLASHNTNGGLDWRVHVITPQDFINAGLAQTSTMRFRFTINDSNPQSIVEGGLDAFIVGEYIPAVSVDTNLNWIPDECEPDCDNNQVMDYAQIQANMALDLNRNMILDSCEDCNNNQTPDIIDLDHAHNVWITTKEQPIIREYFSLYGTQTNLSDNAGIQEGQDLIITPDRRVLVTSKLDSRVLEFSVGGQFVGNLVSSGAGGLSDPAGMLVHNDDLLVASAGTNSVKRYDLTTGASLGDFIAAGSGGLVGPFGVTHGLNGNIFVTSSDNRVLEYDADTGAFIGEFVTAGSGGLSEPRGLLFMPETDKLLVVSYGSNNVLQYDGTTGAFERQFNVNGTATVLTLDQPWCIRRGPEGHVYVSRSHDHESGGGGPSPLHLTNARIYHFNPVSGFLERAYIQGVNSGIEHATGFDFVPDAGTDCNFNQIPDECDITSGRSQDVNNNGIPDECEGNVCYPDCDQSTGPGVLDIFDFLCFGNNFDQGNAYACDCDTSTGPGVCDIFDFLCFGNAFSVGCP